MRTFLALGGLVAALTTFAPTADACSARGRHCGYPAWAANAFEDSTGRAPPGSYAVAKPPVGTTKPKR